jgi:hypothetical protein
MTDISAVVGALDQSDGAEPAVNVTSTSTACLWCGRPFPARRGGSPKRFCCATHRTAFWSALRRWAERAVAVGALTVDQIRNADPAACTVLPGGKAPAPRSPAEKATFVASAERLDDTEELLDDLLLALFDLPGDAWPDLAAALTDELYNRIDQYIERCLQES